MRIYTVTGIISGTTRPFTALSQRELSWLEVQLPACVFYDDETMEGAKAQIEIINLARARGLSFERVG